MDIKNKEMSLEELFWATEPKTDKFRGHNYGKYYFKEFDPIKEKDIKLLEIGINYGFSVNLWSKFFINGEIHAVDIKNMYGNLLDRLNNINLYIQDAYTQEFSNKFEDRYFDYVIEDGIHSLSSQLEAIKLFLPKIKTGGKMVIEDIQGMGYVKEIIKYCEHHKLTYNFYDLRGKEDDLIIEIIKK